MKISQIIKNILFGELVQGDDISELPKKPAVTTVYPKELAVWRPTAMTIGQIKNRWKSGGGNFNIDLYKRISDIRDVQS